MRLSRANIPTLLLIGNHDIAPAEYRAHTLQEFETLSVPHIYVADDLRLWGPAELGVAAQVITIPWVTRSRFLARHDMTGKSGEQVMDEIAERIQLSLQAVLESQIDPALPVILTAHASVHGARYGSERQVMLGQDLTLSSGLVTDPRLDYVALGHIHKHQVLNDQPPVVYAGSIERIDFGEAGEKKGYVLAEVERGRTTFRFVPLNIRPFIDKPISITDPERFMETVMADLPARDKITGAICRLRIEFPQQYEPLLDEKAIRDYFDDAFDLRLIKHRLGEDRSRLPKDMTIESLSPLDLLTIFWRTKHKDRAEIATLLELASEVLGFDPSTQTVE
jgi:exonuclease SbcD